MLIKLTLYAEQHRTYYLNPNFIIDVKDREGASFSIVRISTSGTGSIEELKFVETPMEIEDLMDKKG